MLQLTIKSDKVATKQTKQTNDRFSAKNKQIIPEPNFTKSERKVRFGQFFLKIILSISRKMMTKIEFPFKKGFKKWQGPWIGG